MNIQLHKLIALQEIDREIDELKKSQGEIPRQIENSRAVLNEKKKTVDDAKAVIETLLKKRKQAELDVQTENDHMAKARVKLPAVKTNKEYSAILAEIETIKTKIAKIEDEELEVMEALEEKEKELPGIEEAFRAEQKQFEEYQAQKKAEAERVEKELEAFSLKREEIANSLEPVWRGHYEKVSRGRQGEAVVPLKGNTCGGCFQQVLPQLVIEIKTSEKIHFCENCSRILYWETESKAETAVPK